MQALAITLLCFCTVGALQIDPGLLDSSISSSTNKPNRYTEDSVVLTSPRITDWGRYGRWAQCTMSHSYVTGFLLKVESYEKDIDNTAVNGITLSCGIPEQKEIERISSANGPWGKDRDRRFCEHGPAIGFQLKVQRPQGKDVDDAATINVRMICEDGQILEGFDEQGNDYPDSLWSEPVVCPEGMAVCGIQTQVEPRQWWRDDTAMNNIRVKCCKQIDDPQAHIPSNNPKLDYNLTYFRSQNGTGKNETFHLKYGRCYNIPFRWRRQVGSIVKTTPCFRLWHRLGCNGASRCYCDDSLLKLDDTFTMTKNMLWYEHFTAVGPCHMGGRHDDESYVDAILYSGSEEEKTGLVLAPHECLTYYEGDGWAKKTEKVLLAKGCLELYDDEECTGASLRVNSQVLQLGSEWANRTVSVKNCWEHKI